MSSNGTAPRRRPRIATIPNALSLLRLIAIPFYINATLRGDFTLAFVLFVGAGVTDVLDGWIARRFDQRSGIGALLDPFADKLMMVSGYILYTIASHIVYKLPVWLTFTVFIRDLLIALFAYLLYTRVRIKRFPPSIPGKISTVLQVAALAAAIASNTAWGAFAIALRPLFFKLALLATLYSGFDYMRRAGGMLNPDLATRS